MEYIQILFNKNTETLTQLFGANYVQHSGKNTLNTDEVLEANEVLGETLYGQEVASLIRANNTRALDKMHLEVLESASAPEFLINSFDTNKIGLVALRPEALGLGESSKKLLTDNGLKILLDKTTQIDFYQYWSIYAPGMRDPEARYDFPTRTLNYINKDIRIFAVADETGENESVSDFITKKLKGEQGSFNIDTLRGHVAYNALKGLVDIDGTSFVTPQANIALDPIGAYRQLVQGTVESDRMHATADTPLLFYAGQAVHVPDRDEIRRDIRVLLTEDEITHISEELNR